MPVNSQRPLPLSLIVVGASGDLATRKIFPSLFALYCQEHLPSDFRIFGFARSQMTQDEFRSRVEAQLACRYVPRHSCAERMQEFLSRCHYVAGDYASADAYLDLYQFMRGLEAGREANRLFYLAIPPTVFLEVARSLGDSGLVACGTGEPWSRVVIEKPFGRDRASSDGLVEKMSRVFSEEQTFRIDHYLGKEVIQNLMVLRFANRIFEPLWTRESIESVRITWKEEIGIGSRAGYFDAYGIIRDVMQNHLLQIMALCAMEAPERMSARQIRDEKVRVLRAIPPLTVKDVVVGQYGRGALFGGQEHAAYREEPGVSPRSITPTFASAVLRVDNPRWQGIPFVMSAGKGLNGRGNDITVRFRPLEQNRFRDCLPALPPNALVIRIQPDEGIRFRIVSKVPGLRMELQERELDLRYATAFEGEIPDAYECLLLDVLRGDRSLFIRADELAAAWDIFTPVLHAMETQGLDPEPYPFGSAGPAAAAELEARAGCA